MPKKARLENTAIFPIMMTEENYLAMQEGKKEFLKILPTWNQTTWGEFTKAHKEAMLKDNQFVYQLWFFDYLTKMYDNPCNGLPTISKAQQNKLFLSFIVWLDIQDLKLLFETCQKVPCTNKLTWKTWDEILVLTQHRKSLNNTRLIKQALLKMFFENNAAEQFEQLRKEGNLLDYRANPFDKVHDLDLEQTHVLQEILRKFTKQKWVDNTKKLTDKKLKNTFVEVTEPGILNDLKRDFSKKIRESLVTSSSSVCSGSTSVCSSSALSTRRHSLIEKNAVKTAVSVFTGFPTLFPRIPRAITPSISITAESSVSSSHSNKRKR